MKKFLALSVVFFSAAVAMAQPPNVPADKGTVFGNTVTADKAMKVSDMVSSLKGKEGQKMNVKVEGEVVQVCEAEGCWLRMKNGEGTIMVRMKDHKFLVPTALNGKKIIVQGVAELKETSVAQLKHYAEDAGKSKEEIEKIKEPKKEVVLNAEGIVVM